MLNETSRLALIKLEVSEASKLLGELPESPGSAAIAAIRRMLMAATAKLEILQSQAAIAEESERNK